MNGEIVAVIIVVILNLILGAISYGKLTQQVKGLSNDISHIKDDISKIRERGSEIDQRVSRIEGRLNG